jgi:hypothetical protein
MYEAVSVQKFRRIMSYPIHAEKRELRYTNELKPLNTMSNQNCIKAVYRLSFNYVNYRNMKLLLGLLTYLHNCTHIY